MSFHDTLRGFNGLEFSETTSILLLGISLSVIFSASTSRLSNITSICNFWLLLFAVGSELLQKLFLVLIITLKLGQIMFLFSARGITGLTRYREGYWIGGLNYILIIVLLLHYRRSLNHLRLTRVLAARCWLLIWHRADCGGPDVDFWGFRQITLRVTHNSLTTLFGYLSKTFLIYCSLISRRPYNRWRLSRILTARCWLLVWHRADCGGPDVDFWGSRKITLRVTRMLLIVLYLFS